MRLKDKDKPPRDGRSLQAQIYDLVCDITKILRLIGNQFSDNFLHKSTMQEMRSLSNQEKEGLISNKYKGVLLHGYYEKGDTPQPIAYYPSSITESDDEGSIIDIDSNIKLRHKFYVCDMSYYGLQAEVNNPDVANRNTFVINNAIRSARKVLITIPGKYWCRGNRGGESGSYYRYEDPTTGTAWWQVGDGNGQPGGINMLSDRTLEMSNGVTLKMRGTFMQAYNFITIWNKKNVTIRGGEIVGDFDLDPLLNEHKRSDGSNDDGQWGYGISLQGSKNVKIENIEISKMWADGINIAPDYLHNYELNTNILMRNVLSSKNRRQGMSIDGGLKMSFYDCEFSETKGQDPQCGVDLEKDTIADSVIFKDILFYGCKFSGNKTGARTALTANGKMINVKFDNCVYDGNELDYDSYSGTGVKHVNCRFDYQEDRFYSILLVGARNHSFEDCEIGNGVDTIQRDIDNTSYRCNNIIFDRCKSLEVRYNVFLLQFFTFSNSKNVKVNNCNFESISLQNDRRLFIADGAENIEITNNHFRELGQIFVFKNINGFKFNDNSVINTLRVTGILEGNVKHFEFKRNTISGNSYYVANALAPALYLAGPGNAYGSITDNEIYDDNIFDRLGNKNGAGTGLYREYASASDHITVANNKTHGYTNETAFQFNEASTNLSISYMD